MKTKSAHTVTAFWYWFGVVAIITSALRGLTLVIGMFIA